MASIFYFCFSLSFMFGLWRHMLRDFQNEVMAVIAQI